jgi:chromosome segregation ATPase
MDRLKNNLTGIVSLIGVVGAIGAGFTTYGQLLGNISSLEEKVADLESRQYVINETVDLTDTNNKINENYVAVTDRITELQEDINNSASNLGILKTRIDLLDAQINELKLENSNPLTR